MTKQLKLGALIAALVASTGALAHEKLATPSANNHVKWFVTATANAGKTLT